MAILNSPTLYSNLKFSPKNLGKGNLLLLLEVYQVVVQKYAKFATDNALDEFKFVGLAVDEELEDIFDFGGTKVLADTVFFVGSDLDPLLSWVLFHSLQSLL